MPPRRRRKDDGTPDATASSSDDVYRPDSSFSIPVLDAFFRDRRYFATQHHIDSFDDFISSRLQAIVRSMNPLTMVREDPLSKILYTVRVYVGGDAVLRPAHGVHLGPGTFPASPAAARLGNLTYGAEISADVHVVYMRDGEALEPRDFERVPLGFLPLMVHSSACVLRGLDPGALRSKGECPYDMGGYFVIDGREKVIVTQEDRVANRLYMRLLDADSSSSDDVRLKAFIRCVSSDVRDVFPRTTVFRVKRSGEITVAIRHLSGDPIPIATVFRALGVETDRDIMRAIFREDVAKDDKRRGDREEVSFLRPSLIAGHAAGGFSRASAVAFLVPRTRFGTQLDLKGVLLDNLFPNVERTFEAKAIALGAVVRRLVRCVMGSEPVSDLDDYANKRLLASGSLVADMFRDAYLQSGAACLRAMNAEFVAGPWRVADDVRTLVNDANLRSMFPPYIVTDALARALKGSARDTDNSPVQELTRASYLGYLSHVRRVNNPVDRSVVPASAHGLRASHWGVLCPVETPDGPNVGLLTHLATLTCLSTSTADDSKDKYLRPILSAYSRPLDSIGALTPYATEVLLDDTWIAVTDRPSELVTALRSLRRGRGASASQWRTLGVTWDVWLNVVSVRTDRGRCCRPLRLVPLVDASSASWDALLADGAIELIDVEEMATCLVAMNEADMLRSPLNRYTHTEISAAASSLSLVTNTYPLLHHNHGPYNNLCLAQFKQAVGVCMTSLRERFDTIAYLLHHAQRPVVATSFSDRLFGGAFAHGENLVVAIATYSGFNQEDAVLLNLDSVQRGRLALTVYDTHRLEEAESVSDSHDNSKDRILFANPGRLLLRGYSVVAGSDTGADASSFLRQESFSHLDDRGLPLPGSILRDGSVLAGMVRVQTGTKGQLVKEGGSGDFVDVSKRLALSGAQDDVAFAVDGVSLLDGEGTASVRSCKIRLRHVRSPESGDKLSSRFGQKGVVGILLPAADMPFCEADGIVPDLIINPNGFPKRMTVAHIIESALGKRAAEAGGRLNADTFGGGVVDGTDIVESPMLFTRNGRSGDRAEGGTNVGINYYGRLKHMVTDKLQSRSTGAIDMVTRQPAKSSGQSGGLRIGEMEQNALLAHGLGSFLRESFMQRSDKGVQLVDASSGGSAGWWTHTDDPEAPRDARDIETPYNFQLMQHELAGLGIRAALEIDDTASHNHDHDIDEHVKKVSA